MTLVWARRFAGYKRPDLLLNDLERFFALISHPTRPVQVIWAGKPYPYDYGAIDTFNRLIKLFYQTDNVAVLTGYELDLSRKLKQGTDIWLNTPRRPREASGTSGMTAAMNGALNLSTQDGWIPEFGRHGENSFLLPVADDTLPHLVQDTADYYSLMQMLETEVIPTFYQDGGRWVGMMMQSMRQVVRQFGSDRMADEYYKDLYQSA